MRDTRGISKGVVAVVLICIVFVVALLAFGLQGGSSPATDEVEVFIDDEKQTGDPAQSHTLTWLNAQPGNTYTKNFTVANNGNQTLFMRLFTVEPIGATVSWPHNNTDLGSKLVADGTLTLTLGAMVGAGGYTWKLLTGNATVPTPTPTPTTEPMGCQFILDAESGVENITVTNDDGDTITLTKTMLPVTFNFTSGDDLAFQTYPKEGFTFNAWLFSDSTFKSDNPVTLPKVMESFNITALYNEP